MIRAIENTATVCAALVLLLVSFVTFGDVVGRTIFARPFAGASELTELGLMGITFLVYPQLAYRQHHITVDLFDIPGGPRVRRLQEALAGLVGAAVFLALAYWLWVTAERSAQYGDETAALHIPLAAAQYFMSFSSGLTAAAFVARARLALMPPLSPEVEADAKSPKGAE